MTKRKPNRRSSVYYSETDGYWHGWVFMGRKPNGAPDRRHRKARTETEIWRKVQDLEDERATGTAGKAGGRLRVAGWMTTYLETIAPRNVRASTLRSSYEPKIRRWIIPGIGQHWLDELEPEHVDRFYTSLAEKGLAPNTILQVHRILMRALKIAYKRQAED